MNSRPKISVVTVSYNAATTIEKTIQSVIYQSYPNIEYIIIDGGSTDGTIDVIKKYEDRIAYWVSEPDKGIYDAMNKGISRVTGSFVGIINADDWYAQNAIEIMANHIISYPEIDFFYGDMIVYYSEKKQSLRHSDHIEMKKGICVTHPTSFVRKSVYDEKQFSLNYKMAGDYDFMLWCFMNGKKFMDTHQVISYFTPGGLSSVPSIKYMDSFYIWKEYIGTYKAICYFSRDFFFKLWKYPIKRGMLLLLGNDKYWKLLSRIK